MKQGAARAWVCLLALAAAACGAVPEPHLHIPPFGPATEVEEPLYGAKNRQADPLLKRADDQLIDAATREYGSRHNASVQLTKRGLARYRKNDLAGAMRRFNQAWILDPDYPEVYWGFGAIYNDQKQYCDTVRMNELAFSKGPLPDGFLPDVALSYVSCATTKPDLDPKQHDAYLERAEQLFAQAAASTAIAPGYTQLLWSRALYLRGDYAQAWKKIAQYRRITGHDAAAADLQPLREKMPEPAGN